MYIRISLDSVPPAVELMEPDDFKAFKVVVESPEHAYVPVATLRALAGERDAEWEAGLERMVAFAARHEWVNPDGEVRAHIELKVAR